MIQAIILDNKIFIPCTCIYEGQATLHGHESYEIKGYVTPDLTYFIETQIGIDINTKYEIIELNEDSPYRNFQFEDLDIENLEIPYKYYSQLPYYQSYLEAINGASI